ncbi:MAG: FAD-dependent oxidoreductase [Xanthobacteraceae bacterium]|nr:FAD-dependent oxidoreductase [Xanthobacteraceae bacterium]
MSGDAPHVVIVGAGQAGLQAAETLRSAGFDGRVTLIGDEPHPPYQRPPLSKAWLTGGIDGGQLTLRDPGALARKDITLRTGARVVALDSAARQLHLSDGTRLGYTGLVLATGATPRTLPGSIAANGAVRVLRSRDDASAIAQSLQRCRDDGLPLVVIGGGFIGLEVAASARKLGIDVTILEAAPRLLERALPAELSAWYANLHRTRGADLVLGARIARIDGAADGRATVHLADGRTLHAGLVVAGIGVTPNDALARAAGIACDNGIIVDDCGRTSAPNITAAGDCTVRRLPDGGTVRLESVQNAIEQGRAAAHALLGEARPFAATPWFWSDQYDIKLQIAGLSRGADNRAVRGDMTDTSFSIFHYRGTQLIAVDSINSARDHMLSRQLIAAGISPTHAQIADLAFNLASLRPKAM